MLLDLKIQMTRNLFWNNSFLMTGRDVLLSISAAVLWSWISCFSSTWKYFCTPFFFLVLWTKPSDMVVSCVLFKTPSLRGGVSVVTVLPVLADRVPLWLRSVSGYFLSDAVGGLEAWRVWSHCLPSLLSLWAQRREFILHMCLVCRSVPWCFLLCLLRFPLDKVWQLPDDVSLS